MNWYSIFYWMTVADGVKNFFDVFSNIFTWIAVIAFIAYIIFLFLGRDPDNGEMADKSELNSLNHYRKYLGRTAAYATVVALILWAGYVFTPTKKDCYIIVAGGAVGNFITKDTSVRQIPAEAMALLRDKIREMKDEPISQDVKDAADTLKDKSKEQLIELLKRKSQ